MNYGKSSDWKIEFDDGFAEDLKRLGKAEQDRIKKYLKKLKSECSHPNQRGEPLKGNLTGLWKYRVGNYRLLCQILEDGTVTLYMFSASHRSKSYSDKSVEQLIKRILDLQKKPG